ncbi:two-component system, OmpR family, sensor histidine kinase KdpD [Nocardioides alpinus]|uniref:histidine kinase n=1 Tax=Nocardioides alpinus TaxID=748909 RepID=A0A1I0ZAH4_9ACTN|nr:ATP-binding protein [Nocardioides alpinus]PKH38348.1 sensor histidine kinase KdpD [Nocardioides alpinus]SFB21408.1 two-component system, OmpR family, sensor histidine kinase KdpD [Nocardioides alpinus]
MPVPTERGRLRVYLGAAPGVGKTYAMLDEGHRRLERGTDLVVGYVETHGRPRTERELEGLEVVPRRQVDYRGTVQEEMDLEAILARHPDVVLVDELAHTNVPGSTHDKRWQDVEALRDAGIEVITTVNIQHVESLNDVTEAITGVRQRETVPDHVVRSADQIELVDMSPQSLRRRMAHGNIYAADKIDAALSRYFREGNLTALRELALLWLADRVDEGLERYRDQHDIEATWATRERIVVPVSGGPESTTLMRRAARIATRRSGGEWQALYVTRRDGLTGISPDSLTHLAAKADELGGTFHTVVGDDPADAILAFARAENATQVVIGASRRGRVSTVVRPGVGERVVAGSGDIDIHIVTHDYARGRSTDRRPDVQNVGPRRRLAGFAFGLAVPVLLSLLLSLTRDLHGLPIEAMSLMVVVVATALIGGLAPAVVSALASALLLNYLFTPPLYTLTIAEPENVVTIAIFVAVGIAVATVVDNAARRTAEARAARAEADALTVLAHSLLTSTDDLPGLLSSACRLFSAQGAAVLRRDDTGVESVVASYGTAPASVESADMSAAIDDRSTLVLSGATLPASRRGLLNAYAAYAKVMEERRRATAAEVDRLRLTEVDRTRTALLAAVSHDLRNPLAAVKVAVASLRSTEVAWSAEDEAELLLTIEESTDRLTALVANLLDMSRISTGSVRVARTEVDLAAAVRAGLAPLPGGERIEVDVDPDVVVLADAGLLDRVIANIGENALKYTPDSARVRIDATATPDRVVLRIADSGPGVRDRDRDRLFAPFQRLGDVPQQDGVGLGLAVAHGLTEAMGGTIATEETPGGGLTFVLELPAPSDAEPPETAPAHVEEPA